MDISGKSALVLGGAGLVGQAVCRALLAEGPIRLVVAARRRARAEGAVARLRAEHASAGTVILPAWGDALLRADWQTRDAVPRETVLADPVRRRRLVEDVFAPLDAEIVDASWLVQVVTGACAGLGGVPARIVVDCMNTATAVSYQDLYGTGARVLALTGTPGADVDWPAEVERLLAASYLPQLVRHVQLLHAAMRRAGTEAYVKVGTSGSGGYGFNIPYTHGEERPSRLLLAKSGVAGAQTLLTFLLARTPDAPPVVKTVMPSALIGWGEIGHGPIRRRGRVVERCDCDPGAAVPADDPASLVPEGAFGEWTGAPLEAVYIDTGENGLFSADEFIAISAPGQMQMVTAEEIATNVVREIRGASTGRDLVAALDGAAMGPSHRAGAMRHGAVDRLRRLEARHGKAVAFEMLGPPRLSKLLFEVHLLELRCATVSAALARSADALADVLERDIVQDRDLRQRILSIGLGILMPDGERLLRGPVLKARTAEEGWVDLTVANLQRWQARLRRIAADAAAGAGTDSSSRGEDRFESASPGEPADPLVPGEVAAWIFTQEESGERMKA